MISSGAKFSFSGQARGQLRQGTNFTVISNTAGTPIGGTFVNLADGSTLTVGQNTLRVSYSGGDGNDLVPTVVP